MSELTKDEILEFARHFTRVIEAGDAERAKAFYAPTARIWHNTDYREIGPDENVAIFARLKQALPDMKLIITHLEVIAGGFVQADRLEATLPDGTPFRLSSCTIVKIENGLIVRVDEFIDSAETKPLRALQS